MLTSCSGVSSAVVDPLDEIDQYIRSIPILAVEEAGIEEGPRSANERDGDFSCATQHLKETRQLDRIVAYSANSASLWPGAIVAGESLESGLFTQVPFQRAPLVFSISLENLAGGKSVSMQNPTLSAYREALGNLLEAEVTGATPANLYAEINEVHSEEQLALAMSASVSWIGNAASVAASFDFNREGVRSRFLVKYTQSYYTVDVDQPTNPSSFFSVVVDPEEVREKIPPTSPPLYVTSITYGRMVVFTFESDYSATEMAAALQFAYRGGVEVSGDVSVTYRDIVSSSKITSYILGGSGGDAAQSIDSFEALMEFIKSGGNYSRESPGAPIAYTLSYLRDNAPARLSLTEEYSVRDCVRVSQKIRVTLDSIRVDKAGGDGDDLELYGQAWAIGTESAMLFDRAQEQFVQIREGESWPASGGPINEVVVSVVPEPGRIVEVGARLTDYDGNIFDSDDFLGEEVIQLAYETGWRRSVTVLLTGDKARVEVTFSLEPI